MKCCHQGCTEPVAAVQACAKHLIPAMRRWMGDQGEISEELDFDDEETRLLAQLLYDIHMEYLRDARMYVSALLKIRGR